MENDRTEAGPSWLFLIGAPKCGTTSAAAWLGRYPSVDVARVKEPCFFTDFAERDWTGPGVARFAEPWVSDRAAYEALFEVAGADWRVDASTDYLWCPGTAERLARFRDAGNRVKVAAILRDPVARAISEHRHLLRDGFTAESLGTALDREAERRSENMNPLYYHVTRSSYAAPVARYRALFGADFLVLDYHRLDEELHRLGGFLDLSDPPPPPPERLNAGGPSWRHPAARRVMKNKKLMGMMRRLVPKGIRQPLRALAERSARKEWSPKAADVDALQARLAEEIAACRADPDIPTDLWPATR